MLKALKRYPLRALLALGLVALPALIFYVTLFRLSYNLPNTDDYHAILTPVMRLEAATGVLNHLRCFFEAQHNEYKLWLAIALAWSQAKLFGQLNFQVLSLIGDTSVLGLGIVLWRLFPLRNQGLAERLLWFAPASWLLFQLSYGETLNWTMADLQNVPVIPLSFLAVGLVTRGSRASFAWSVLFLVLAVAASGNGFLVVLIGALALALQRHYKRLLCWLAVSALLVQAYAYHYNVQSSQVASHRSVFVTLRHFSVVYTLAMMGSEGTHYGSIVLGLSLLALNAYLLWSGYFRRHPAVGYCTLFLIATAIGVGGIRSEFGLRQAISSRYRMYCLLLLIFAWFACVERLHSLRRPELSRKALGAALLAAMLFSLRGDIWGSRFLSLRKTYTEGGMQAYQRSLVQGGTLGPVFWKPDENPIFEEINPSARVILGSAIADDLYIPPKSPDGGQQ